MIVWSQFSIVNQNFDIIRVIMKPQIFLLETNKHKNSNHKLSSPLAYFLEMMLFLSMPINALTLLPGRGKLSFCSLPLELGRPFVTPSTHRIWQMWHCMTFKPKKPWRFCIFPRTFTFKRGAGAPPPPPPGLKVSLTWSCLLETVWSTHTEIERDAWGATASQPQLSQRPKSLGLLEEASDIWGQQSAN